MNYVGFHDLVPYPSTHERPISARKKRKVAHAQVLTTSPYKHELEAAKAELVKVEETRKKPKENTMIAKPEAKFVGSHLPRVRQKKRNVQNRKRKEFECC
jgi:hypothetical protein